MPLSIKVTIRKISQTDLGLTESPTYRINSLFFFFIVAFKKEKKNTVHNSTLECQTNFPIKIDLCLHQSGPVTAPPSHATLNSGPKPPIFPKLIYIPRRDNRGEERERERGHQQH